MHNVHARRCARRPTARRGRRTCRSRPARATAMPMCSARPRSFPTWRSASTRRPIRPGPTIGPARRARGRARRAGAAERLRHRQFRDAGGARGRRVGLRAVAVADPEISARRAEGVASRRRARPALQPGRPPRRAQCHSDRYAARCRGAHRTARLAHRAAGQSRRGRGLRRDSGGAAGSDRARPPGLSARRRARLAARSRASPICCACSHRPLLDQADRPVSHFRVRASLRGRRRGRAQADRDGAAAACCGAPTGPTP